MDEVQMIQFFASKQDLKQGLDGLREEVRGIITETRSDLLTHLDQQLVILRRLDQERVFGSQRVDNLEKRVDKVEGEIGQLQLRTASA